MEGVERLQISFPADKGYLSLIGGVVREMCARAPGLSPSAGYNVELAVDEAVVNVISHAYEDDPSGRVELTFEIHPDRLEIQVRDWGLSFDPSAIPEPDLDSPQERGYGVYLIRHLMDQVSYQADGTEGNCVTMVKLAG